MAALLAYARMADDKELFVLAMRVRAHAIRKVGDLLLQIPPERGPGRQKPGNQNTFENIRADAFKVTTTPRQQATKEAGLSKKDVETAIRVAAVPQADFDRQVESPAPPRITQLAQQGMQARTMEREAAKPPVPGIKPRGALAWTGAAARCCGCRA
ncbi:MAG: hypothetical protein AB7F35_18595 [Acetobacteraceae bacterium]